MTDNCNYKYNAKEGYFVNRMVQMKIFMITIPLMVCMLCDLNVQAYNNSDTTSPEYTVISYIINDLSNARVTGKSLSLGYDLSIDGVYCCTIRHDVSFTYGISTSNGDIAQITSAVAYVLKTNSESQYYPNEITTSKSNGSIAKFTSNTKIYKKSTNKKHGTLSVTTYCYASGKYY